MTYLCWRCRRLPRCKHLTARNGSFAPERLVLEDGACIDFLLVGKDESIVRSQFQDLTGGVDTSLLVQAVHMREVATVVEEEVEEEEEEMEVPDFMGMLHEGITVQEREKQLRYQTDDSGKLLADTAGQKIPRGSYVLRAYACDPHGPIKCDPKIAAFWKIDKLIMHILTEEFDKGLIVKKKGKEMVVKINRTKTAAAPVSAPKEPVMDPDEVGDEEAEDAVEKPGPSTRKRVPKKSLPEKAIQVERPSKPESAPRNENGNLLDEIKGLRGDMSSMRKMLEKHQEENRVIGTLLHDAIIQKINSALIALAGNQASDFSCLWEVVPTGKDADGDDVAMHDGENLMSKSGDKNNILSYLTQVADRGEQ